MSKFTKRQVAEDKNARWVYSMVGWPSLRDFKVIIKGGMLNGCPVTIESINNAETIFDPDVPALKGKTTRPKAPVVRSNIIAVPPEIMEHHSTVELTADVMFVKKIPFVVTLSRKFSFGTSQFI